ncbi:MAG: cytochrome P450 [Alphaproteobacteria bacterium]|nr:cytochrome P450 [Alphaproteobacteria bacterium]
MKASKGTSTLHGYVIERPGLIAQFFITLLVRHLIPAVFGLLRRIAPVFRFPFTNTVIVTSFDHVQEVSSRQNDFPVPYQKQVDLLGWKPSFLLAMKDTPDYWKTLEQVKKMWADDDLVFVRQIAKEVSEEALNRSGGKIDAIQQLMVPVTEAVIERYYGVPIPAEKRAAFFDATMHVAGFLFGSQNLTDKSIATAQGAAKLVFSVIDDAISAARQKPLPENTVIGRCHAQDITDDQHLRSYLMGMIMGYLPTNTLANGHALDIILNNQDAYKYGQTAATETNYDLVLKVVHEALRISYILPGLWRTTPQETELGIGSAKTYKVEKGRMIYISAMAAMMDKRRIKSPNTFDPYRSRDVYMIYGYQFHYCVGAAIADVMMQEIFMAVLKRQPKANGKMVFNGNFPWSLEVSYAPGDAS